MIDRARQPATNHVRIGLRQGTSLESAPVQPKENLGKEFNFIHESKRRRPNDNIIKLGKKELIFPGKKEFSKRIFMMLKKETKAMSENLINNGDDKAISKIIE